MIKANAIEAVLQGKDTLDLVCLNHSDQHIANRKSLVSLANALPAQVVCDRENTAQIVRRMSPFRGEPRVVIIEPTHDRTDVECGLNRVELVTGSRHARPCSSHRCARDNRPEKLGASGIIQRKKSASKRVHEAKARGIKRFVTGYLFDAKNVIGDLLQKRIWFRTHGTPR